MVTKVWVHSTTITQNIIHCHCWVALYIANLQVGEWPRNSNAKWFVNFAYGYTFNQRSKPIQFTTTVSAVACAHAHMLKKLVPVVETRARLCTPAFTFFRVLDTTRLTFIYVHAWIISLLTLSAESPWNTSSVNGRIQTFGKANFLKLTPANQVNEIFLLADVTSARHNPWWECK